MSKEAMNLALEALESGKPMFDAYWGGNQHDKAITALRQALANEALDKKAENARELGLDYEPAQQEPVAFYVYKPVLPRGNLGNVSDGDLPWVYDQDPSSGFSARMLVAPVTSPPAQRKESK